MEFDHLFNGSALSAVDAKGRLSVPAGIRSVVERRSEAKAIVIGMHESSPCLIGYDRNYERWLYKENERLRLREEEQGKPSGHFARARRTFGLTEEATYDPSGRIVLPPMMRNKGQIDDHALFVGVGGVFEIWNPKLALQSDDEELRDLAAYRLGEKGVAQ